MEFQLQWFGIALSPSSLLGLLCPMVLQLVALLPVRRADTIAGLALAGARCSRGRPS
jgi:predicted benzoate:H+ symporter BenE